MDRRISKEEEEDYVGRYTIVDIQWYRNIVLIGFE
jgi:hypothetical protein